MPASSTASAFRRPRVSCFPHNDAVALERLLHQTPCGGHRVIVVESLFSMDGDLAPLREYAALCRSTGATLIVDEAHAVGIYGARGSGLDRGRRRGRRCPPVSQHGRQSARREPAPLSTVLRWAIDYLIQHARPFVFSTAPPPALAAAIDASLDIVADEPDGASVWLPGCGTFARSWRRLASL